MFKKPDTMLYLAIHIFLAIQVVGYLAFFVFIVTSFPHQNGWLLILVSGGYGSSLAWSIPAFSEMRKTMKRWRDTSRHHIL